MLRRFAIGRDETAFAVLVRRHGPTVLRVCRGVLGHEQGAEDRFQAAFLKLARRASSAGWRQSVGPWLYEVAYQADLKARTAARRRRPRECRAAAGQTGALPPEVSLREAEAALHEEVARLPERLRLPVVLYHVAGRTHLEAARELGYSGTTFAHR